MIKVFRCETGIIIDNIFLPSDFAKEKGKGGSRPSAFLSRTGGNRCCPPASTSSCFIGNRLPRLIHARAAGLHTRRCCRWLHPPLAPSLAPSARAPLVFHRHPSAMPTESAHPNWPKRTNCKTLELQLASWTKILQKTCFRQNWILYSPLKMPFELGYKWVIILMINTKRTVFTSS